MTLNIAFERYFNEKVDGQAQADNVLGQLARVAEHFGPDLFLSQLTLNDLLLYQTQLKQQGLAPRTINGYVVEIMRPVVKQSRKWGINRGPLATLTDDDWRELKLTLPAHRTRSGSRAEMALLMSKLRKDYRPIILFSLKSGLRKGALIFKRSQIDWDNRLLRYHKKSKRTGDVGWLPLTDRMIAILKNEIRRGGDSEWVFTFKAKSTRGNYVAKQRYPITGAGLKSQMQLAVEAAGLEDWRLIHDLRHTAATETLRSSQNLGAVQLMLGHSDIAQTSRYAHVLANDARQAMEKRR